MQSLRTILSTALVAGSLLAAPVFAVETNKAADAGKPVAAQSVESRVNINSADAQTLAERLNGVGLKKAQAIVSYREQHGPFKAVDELVNVAGIGDATLAKNRDLISVN